MEDENHFFTTRNTRFYLSEKQTQNMVGERRIKWLKGRQWSVYTLYRPRRLPTGRLDKYACFSHTMTAKRPARTEVYKFIVLHIIVFKP